MLNENILEKEVGVKFIYAGLSELFIAGKAFCPFIKTDSIEHKNKRKNFIRNFV
jgi:hypothetical protein